MSALAAIKGGLLALCLAAAFGLGIAWEHRDRTPFPLSLIAGKSLKAQRDALWLEITTPRTGWAARLDACQVGREALSRSVKEQSDAVEAMRAKGVRMAAEGAKARAAASRALAVASARSAEILSRTPASDDVCASAYQFVRDYAR